MGVFGFARIEGVVLFSCIYVTIFQSKPPLLCGRLCFWTFKQNNHTLHLSKQMHSGSKSMGGVFWDFAKFLALSENLDWGPLFVVFKCFFMIRFLNLTPPPRPPPSPHVYLCLSTFHQNNHTL
jgi:hypothetical protein